MAERIVDWFIGGLGAGLNSKLIVFLLSMGPVLELRGGILAAGPAFLDVAKWQAIPLCIVGNIIPVPFILLLVTKIFDRLKKTEALRPAIEKIEARAMGKSERIEKYTFWGLVAFVAIPLPGTGAWTGALIAALLGIRFRRAFPAIVMGICAAAVIMSVLSYGVIGGIFG